MKRLMITFVFGLACMLLFSACSEVTTDVVETETPMMPTMTSAPEEPTPTLIPAAAIVNGERLPLSWYETELGQYLHAQEIEGQPVEDIEAAREFVLNDLIDQFLMAQAAQESGVIIEDEDVLARIDALRQEVDLDTWMQNWGYTQESLAQSLKWQMLGAKQREMILESIPETVLQVELQQIFAYTETGARNAMGSLNAETPFEEVAFVYDPTAGGYLGWVPKGYLLIPALEQAVFNLPVGEHSEIIESEIGYHIVKVLAREERPLTLDARLTLQRQALYDWFAEKRETSIIEVLID